MGTKKRGKVLMNQKANTVADLAAVLLQQEKDPTAKEIERSETRIKLVERMKRQKGANQVKKKPLPIQELGGTEGVTVRWANILDAEFAETWPVAVVHGVLEQSRYTAAYPIQERKSSKTTDEAKVTAPLDQENAAPQPVAPSQAAPPI